MHITVPGLLFCPVAVAFVEGAMCSSFHNLPHTFSDGFECTNSTLHFGTQIIKCLVQK